MQLKSNVTFHVDSFSYKELFNPMSYGKVIVVLPGHNLFYKYVKIYVYYYFYQLDHIT
jgi:hypothetical protein